MKERKKILLFVQWFVPGFKAGGPINSCKNFVDALEAFFEIYILTTNCDFGEKKTYPNIKSAKWLDYGKHSKVCYLATNETKTSDIQRIIEEIQPAFLYLNSLYSPVFSIPVFKLLFQKKINIPTVLTPRGELNPAAIAIKSYKKKPYLFLLKILGLTKKVKWQATNPLEATLIKKHFGEASSVMIASNLPNQRIMEPTYIKKEIGAVRFVSISRIARIKNLDFFIKILNQIEGEVIFDVYGPNEDVDYLEEMKGTSKSLPDSVNFSYHGQLYPDKITEVLGKYHFFVSPTLGENFGHAIFEGLSAGLPVMISDQTPWLDLKNKGIGYDLSLNSKKDWIKSVDECIKMTDDEYQTMSATAIQFANEKRSSNKVIEETKRLFSN